MKTYHAELGVKTYPEALAIANPVAAKVKALGGEAIIGIGGGDDQAILMVTLPDNAAHPSTLDGGDSLHFYEVHGLVIPQVPDQGIEE